MTEFALNDVVQTRYQLRLDSASAEAETDHSLLLDAVRSQTNSQAVVLYGFQPEVSEVKAITARSGVRARLNDVCVTLSAATSHWLQSLAGTVQGRPAGEPNFEKFPEVLQYQLMSLVITPLRTENHVFGFLTLGRSIEDNFGPMEIDVAQRAGRVLTAVLERDSLQQRLAERKLVERAKGILQQRRKLSEEQAYLLLRNNSRRRRMPMANLAREIIDIYLQPDATRVWQMS